MKPRTARLLAWAALAGSAALGAGAIVITVTSGNPRAHFPPEVPTLQTSFAATLAFGLGLLAFPLVGALIASKHPTNRLGWLFCVNGLVMSLSNFSSAYETHGLLMNPGSLPGAAWFGLVGDTLWVPFITLTTVFLFLLFPEGRLVGRGRRFAGRIGLIAAAAATIGGFLEPTLYAFPKIRNPLGVPASPNFTAILSGPALLVVLGTLLYAVVNLFRRATKATGKERLQFRWFIYSTVLILVVFVPTAIADNIPPAVQALGGAALLTLPASVGIAILRYRLYEIDLVIRKTIVYGALAAFITVVYVGVVIGAGLAIGTGSSNLTLRLIATALVAVGFQPVRSRLRRVANRLVYGERATPYEVLARFSERMAGTYATEDVLPRTARVIAEGTGASRVDVWLRIGDELRSGAAWPADAARRDAISLSGDSISEIPDADHAVPVTLKGVLLGAISVAKPRGQSMTPAERGLVDDLAAQAGLVLSNVRLAADLEARLEEIASQAAELRASRQRIVAAQDDERRRLERNIHDGAQQHLVALAVKLRLTKGLVRRDPAKAREMLAELKAETDGALETLVDLSRGIYPPLLEKGGIAAALVAQSARAGLDVQVDADGVGRYALETEAAVYFCVLEALQNSAKHAGGGTIDVRLGETPGGLAFEVADRGRGFDPAHASPGSGLQNMRDRLSVLGGTVRIESAPGSGTVVRGLVPVAEVIER